MSLFGTHKASKGSIAEVAQMVEHYFKGRGLNPSHHQINSAEGSGWWLTEGSAKVYIFVQDTTAGSVLRITSPLVNIPVSNRENFYRHLLDLNSNLSSCALATFENTVLVVAQRSTLTLDQEELEDMVWNVAYVADLLDNKLVNEFGATFYAN